VIIVNLNTQNKFKLIYYNDKLINLILINNIIIKIILNRVKFHSN